MLTAMCQRSVQTRASRTQAIVTNTQLSAAAWARTLDAALDALDGGAIEIYLGTQPLNPDVQIAPGKRLARLALSKKAFKPASGTSKEANAIASSNALATGTATWFRAVQADGKAVIDGSVGTSDANLILDRVDLHLGGLVTVTGWSAGPKAAPKGIDS